MEEKDPLKPENKSSVIAIPGAEGCNVSDRVVIENSYKRSECVENVEKALNDAFNEFHLGSSCSETFLQSTECFKKMNESISLTERNRLGTTDRENSNEKHLLNMMSDSTSLTQEESDLKTSQSKLFTIGIDRADYVEADIRNSDPCKHNRGRITNPDALSETSRLLGDIETIVDEKSNVVKSDMKLKLSNSNEYLQLIFSPSPLHDYTNITQNTCKVPQGNRNNLDEAPSNMLHGSDGISKPVDNKNYHFIDIEKVDASTISEGMVDNVGGTDQTTTDNTVDESLRYFEMKSCKDSQHSSDGSNVEEDEHDFRKHEDPYEIIQITKDMAIKKQNKPRLLSTTSVDSFSETLKDYVIPSLPTNDVVIPGLFTNDSAVYSSALENVHDSLKNVLEEVEEGIDCTDAVEGHGNEKTEEQSEAGEAVIHENHPASVPCLGDMNMIGSSMSENIYTPSVPLDFSADDMNRIIGSNDGKIVFDTMRSEKEFQPLSQEQQCSLYRNTELELVDEFMTDFIDTELNSGFILKHPLYALLSDYLNARKQVAVNGIQLEAFKADMKDFEAKVWTFEKVSVSESGECQDGNPVSASHSYRVAKFDETMNSKLCRTLSCIQDLVTETYTNNVYLCQLDKLKIEDFLANIHQSFSRLTSSTPAVALLDPITISPEQHAAVSHLKAAISVLFAFQRRFIEDADFVEESRDWLERLVQSLLRVATWRDHLFLLSHVLRCPSGIHAWAVHYIQAASTPHNTVQSLAYMNHVLTLLALITRRVQQRDAFLNSASALPHCNETWVIINDDEDDDDESDAASYSLLKENDLIALLNQIPVDNLVRQLLCIRSDMHILLDQVSTTSLLRLLSMCHHLIDTLYSGLQTYSKHRAFTKRLARLYIHLMEYLTDYFAFLIEHSSDLSNVDFRQVNIEYNSLILQSVRHLSDLNSNTWFFLPQIPFKLTNIHICWTILNTLLRNGEGGHSCTLSDSTVDYLADLCDELSIYLLNTISNLVTGRSPNESIDLVYTVVQYMLHIGYFESKLHGKYNKICENLLLSIVNERSHLITFIINEINNNMNRIHNENGKLLLYLFNYVNIFSYIPNKSDLAVLNNWLLNFNITNKLNNLSRFIISKFNYSEIPHELQVDIALLIAGAWLKHTPDVNTNLSVTLLTDSMSYLIKPLNNEQIFNQWCWQIVYKLRLHLFDLADVSTIRSHLGNWSEFLQSLPDTDSPLNDGLKLLSTAVASNQSLPCYVVLLVTNLGHSLPLINEKAWHILNILINYYRYSSVINVLQHILPLFVQNKDLLINNYTFLNIILSLLNADRTYFKLAKNLIFSNFPGPVLKNLAHVIHYQLNNYHLYGLSSCHELIILWVDILCAVYKQDEMSCAYLLDCILQYCIYDEPLKHRVKESLMKLIQTMPTKNTNTGLFSWVSSNNIILNHTLLTKPLSHYSNFEFFALFNLEIEEYLIQTKTNLWPQLLMELNAASGKTNIDASLKKVCSSLKMTPLTSSHLPLYRYLYFILELHISSSLLSPLLVQKFFSLYLTRVNNVCVGHKFFDGMTNNALSKRLKAKLKEFVAYHETDVTVLSEKQDDDEDDSLQNQLSFTSCLVDLFRSCVLWLDEPRLLEPCLYLPALPPAYDPNRLAGLIQNTTPNSTSPPVAYWYEFINYRDLKASHATALCDLAAAQNRAPSKKPRSVGGSKDTLSPRERIAKRLASYEAGKKLRKLAIRDNKLSTSINKELVINREIMLNTLKLNFNQIVEYSEIYRMQIMENRALNEQLKSLLRTLYTDVRSEVVLNAACDVDDKQSSGYLNCAGPAVIRIQINESKLNNSVEHTVSQNRVEYEGLLKRLMIAPPSTISLSTIYIHNFINVLVQEYNEVKLIGDYKLLQKIKESSICLFYEFLNIYIHHDYIYKPIVHIFNQYVDMLGQVFIRDTEDECFNLLRLILQHPDKLYEMLHKHFNPLHSSPRKYIEMYDLLVCINNLNERKVPSIVLFNLLNKCNVNVWLTSKRPKLSERTQMINLIVNALSNIQTSGLDSSGDTVMSYDRQCIHSTYRKQLVYLLNYEFPEHYGEILNLLLKFSETESLHVSIWYDFINVLIYGEAAVDNIVQGGDGVVAYVRSGLPVSLLRDLTRRYALEQHALSLYELQGTASLLSSHFTKERLQYGLYGLYPKYKTYGEVIGIFLGLVSHALIVQTLYQCKGLVADKLSEQLCPVLVSVYSPWILPYLTSQLTEPTASWIQQLTDDRSILQPWVEADKSEASGMISGFVETMKFLIEMLPASTNMYSFLWQFYSAHFTHTAMREHVLSIVHSHFIHLQWGKFLPNLYDLELMLKLVDQYLPSCHTFLSQVFIQIQWNNVIQKYHQSDATSTKIHCTLLHLLIKLSNEPSIRQSNQITPLLLEAQSYAWHLIDAQWYEQVTNWFVMSYEPHVILQSNFNTSHSPAVPTTIDLAALNLLQTAAGYVTHGVYHPSTSRKRQIFVRAWVRMTLQLATRYKNIIQNQQADVKQSICNSIDKVEVIIGSSVPANLRVYESGLLVSELLTLVNQSSLLGTLSLEALCDWLNAKTHASGGVVISGLLKVSLRDN